MVTVVNPRGQPPASQQLPMARRLDSLVGKTVYLVDTRWPYTHQFIEALSEALSRRFPTAQFIIREKAGSYGEDDPKLWAEIQERGNAAIVGIGH